MNSLKIEWNEDPWGNRHTSVTYKDEQGFNCGSRFNGHLSEQEVKHKIQSYQARTKGK